MDTSRISRKATELVPARRRPVWQTALMWFAGGLAMAAAAGFLFDARRRNVAVDQAVAKGREVSRWGGKKARHLRNRAVGTVAELRSKDRPEVASRS